MKRLTDGERDILREQEADARGLSDGEDLDDAMGPTADDEPWADNAGWTGWPWADDDGEPY